MSKPKIIFFDIDGTLIEKKKSITPKMLETLHALQDNGQADHQCNCLSWV